MSSETPRKWVAIETQGRGNDLDEWVTQYMVIASNDGTNWVPVDGGKLFPGNSDRNTKVRNEFNTPITSRIIRIMPKTWNLFLSMRFDAYYVDA